jgi:hypothetical protein
MFSQEHIVAKIVDREVIIAVTKSVGDASVKKW